MKIDPDRKPMIHNPTRKPQVPKGADAPLVRQETSWEDSQSRMGILYGDRPAFKRLPTPQPPPPALPGPLGGGVDPVTS